MNKKFSEKQANRYEFNSPTRNVEPKHLNKLKDLFLDSSFNKPSERRVRRNNNIDNMLSDNEIATIRDQIR